MFEFFKKLTSKVSKTTFYLGSRLKALFKDPLSEEQYEKLEQILYEADMGSQMTEAYIQEVKRFVKKHPGAQGEEILHHLRLYTESLLQLKSSPSSYQGSPHVILVVGVNGSGKTTSIAKLANSLKKEGKTVLLAAADTFRAGAVHQLTLWSEKIGVDIVKAKLGSDPSGVVFDALKSATSKKIDTVIIDTAGRLQNKADLMHELEKIQKTCLKVVEDAPHEVLLVLDATTGQNGVEQARVFHQFTPLTGIILSKLDGSAKGGIALPIYQELGIPIQWIGLGEKEGDFTPFDPHHYAKMLFDINE
ncbi:signal recognition particle-docking protein FtsY [Rhabdochlamydiaceae symbiont of Dictyostelium giganteum]|uniref:signal recognition particle-docking protein FtsY n=1 Tax=Rhabdochlamydiaceae symbiont of Dictyostelium giganteum TaxID=3342349 RepID=UPI00384C5D3F